MSKRRKDQCSSCSPMPAGDLLRRHHCSALASAAPRVIVALLMQRQTTRLGTAQDASSAFGRTSISQAFASSCPRSAFDRPPLRKTLATNQTAAMHCRHGARPPAPCSDDLPDRPAEHRNAAWEISSRSCRSLSTAKAEFRRGAGSQTRSPPWSTGSIRTAQSTAGPCSSLSSAREMRTPRCVRQIPSLRHHLVGLLRSREQLIRDVSPSHHERFHLLTS